MHHGSLRGFRVWLGAAALVVGVPVTSGAQVPDGEWHAFGRDPANSKYSPLDQITKEHFTDLEIAWSWDSLSQAVVAERENIRPSALMSSPLMANGLVYVSTAIGQAAALDAGVELVVEPINHLQVGFHHSVGEVRDLVAEIDVPAFKLMVDTIHMNIEETSLVDPIRACGAALKHVHLCESNGALLGSGHIDFSSVLAALDEIGYAGFGSVKVYRKAGFRAAAAASLDYLRSQGG